MRLRLLLVLYLQVNAVSIDYATSMAASLTHFACEGKLAEPWWMRDVSQGQ